MFSVPGEGLETISYSCFLLARMPSQNRLGAGFQGEGFGYAVHLFTGACPVAASHTPHGECR